MQKFLTILEEIRCLKIYHNRAKKESKKKRYLTNKTVAGCEKLNNISKSLK